MGEEFLIASPDITGSVLVAKNRLVHFALFPEKEEKVRSFVRARKVAAPNNDGGKGYQKYKGYKSRPRTKSFFKGKRPTKGKPYYRKKNK